jgi:hypothetical protein
LAKITICIINNFNFFQKIISSQNNIHMETNHLIYRLLLSHHLYKIFFEVLKVQKICTQF